MWISHYYATLHVDNFLNNLFYLVPHISKKTVHFTSEPLLFNNFYFQFREKTFALHRLDAGSYDE